MIGTGRYNFPGIRKAGARIIKAALALTTFGAYVIASPFGPLLDKLLEFLVEWMTNKGIILINVGESIVDGHIDQKRFDDAMEKAIEDAKYPGLTDKQKEEIDEKVKDAFRKFAPVGRKPS